MSKNFYLPENAAEDFFPTTDRDKVENNIAVIKLVMKLTENRQQATPEQQAKLATYVGWGGLANEFFDEYNDKYSEQRKELKSLISDKEYRSMRASSLTAYYTNPAVARAMWQKVLDDGLTHGNVLDPSMGTGIFPMTMPKELRNSVDFWGIEIDEITGLIAKQLFPEFHILIKGFQDVKFINPQFDLVITNVPFGETRLLDSDSNKSYYIHDYFLKKSLSLVRNYGEVAIISSTGLLDKRAGNIVKALKDNTDFLGGVRLPDNAFKRIAGTSVTTDVLFFMRDDNANSNVSDENRMVFKDPVRYPLDERVFINDYFWENPDNVLGSIVIQNYHGGTLTVVNHDDFLPDLQAKLSKMTTPYDFADNDNYGSKIMLDVAANKFANVPDKARSIKRYEFGYVGDDVYYHNRTGIIKNSKPTSISFYINSRNDEFVGFAASKNKVQEYEDATNHGEDNIFDKYVSPDETKTGHYKGCTKCTNFYYVDYTANEKARIKGLVDIKNAYAKVIDIQLIPEYNKDKFKGLLGNLNYTYDLFVRRFGVINSAFNKQIFEADDRYALIASLEDHKLDDKTGEQIYVKSEAFYEALVSPDRKHQNVTTAIDALLSSVSEGRGVDFTFMKSIYPDHSTDDLKAELGDNILIDVDAYAKTGKVKYVTKETCLSGDVVTKYETVKGLIQRNDTTADWEHYADLLKKVIPEPLSIADISFRLASAWIPDEVLTKFIYTKFARKENLDNLPENAVIHTPEGRDLSQDVYPVLSYNINALKYKVEREGSSLYRYSNAISIIRYLINSKQPTIMKVKGYDKKDKPIMEPDEVATAQLRTVEKQIEDLYRNFIIGTPEVAQLVEDTYNGLYNRYVNKKYNGSHLHINGLAKNYHLRDYQKNAVQRIIETKRALLAHEVGTGKTLTMISAGFKLKELGLIHRPLYVVPTNLTSQFGQDILKFYPTKKVLITTPEDFKKQNRKRFLARIIANDYDAIVIGHSQFEKVQVSPENVAFYIQDKIDKLCHFLDKCRDSGENLTVKRIEAKIDSYEKKLKSLQLDNQDTFLNFEDLGIDFMFVDEAHNYKNIAPVTRLGRIKGINARTSQRAFDMQMKVRVLQEKYNNGHVVFATGTPVSNSISELWTMMSYIQPDVLERMEIDSFDAFVGAFGLIESVLELNTTGDKYKEQKRFVKFVNLPELMIIYRITTDIQMSDQLDLPIPKAKRFVIKSELTPAQKDKLQELIDRTDAIQDRRVTPEEDNMLKITNEARKLTLDMRLFSNDEYTSKDSKKLQQLADNVYRIYKRTTNVKGTQIIFSDLGTPTSSSNGFDVYHEIKRLLVNLGIPEKQIAFMHDAKNDEQKIQMERLVNAGDIRVLLASTQKGGTGLNVQRRMKAAHHLDVPWRPSDIIQRNGRLVRQGNIFKQVEIYHYITKGSFDNYLWQIIEGKLKYITQVMTSKSPIRAMKDVDSETLTASEFKSIATNNPYLKLKMQVDNQLTLLINKKHAFERNYRSNVRDIEQAKKGLPIIKRRLDYLKQDIADLDIKKVAISDIQFDEFPKSYDKSQELNTRLYDDISNIVWRENPDDDSQYKTIAHIKGFDIKVKYNSRFTSFSQLSAYGTETFTTIYLGKKGMYPVTLNLSNFKHSNYAVKIKNAVVAIPGYEKKWLETKSNYEDLIELGAGDGKFKEQLNLEYLKAKKAVLDPLISADKPVEEIKAAINKFENSWKHEHPDFVVKTDDENNVQTKYSNDPNDFDDSLFDFAKEETKSKPIAKVEPISAVEKPKETVHTAKPVVVKKNVSIKKSKTHVVLTSSHKEAKYESISLFDFDFKEEDSDKENSKVKDNQNAQETQLSLF